MITDLLRPMGDITADLELVLEEMIDGHDLQRGEVLALVYNWINVHRPACIEEYDDGTGSPVYSYGTK